MKKNTKKILSYSILGLFLFAFAMNFVAAANPIGDWLTVWEEGKDFSANFAKYLFWALLSILIFGVSGAIPGLSGKGKDPLKWAVAIIVGFLSMAYITPHEIFVLMTTYSALGFVLGGVLPFIILTAFTFQLASTGTKKKPAQRLMNKAFAWAMWGAFSLFLIYKNLTAPDDSTALWLHRILAGLSVLMFFAIGWMFGKVGKLSMDEDMGQVKDNVRRAIAGRQANVDEANAAADAAEN
ncbi:hypothetical protein HN604_01220 [archaeon]|jgi:hypothetical protein|nr:hypothetical protein [archaeon]MBT6606762.1 hypothetical protein [archaeon]MBT7251765.1 hypothetical protein [archaeon]MBT7660684.1 hypothetical protein [archaeon]